MRKLLLLPFALLVFMACDLNQLAEDIQESLSSFDASVSGAVTSSFSGNAEFLNSSVESQSPMASNLVVDMENKDNPDEIIQLSITIANTTGGVQTGTYEYDIDNTDLTVFGFYYTADDSFIYPDATGINKIVITKVENSSVEGTYDLTLTNTVLGGDKVSVSGTFKAIGVTQTI